MFINNISHEYIYKLSFTLSVSVLLTQLYDVHIIIFTLTLPFVQWLTSIVWPWTSSNVEEPSRSGTVSYTFVRFGRKMHLYCQMLIKMRKSCPYRYVVCYEIKSVISKSQSCLSQFNVQLSLGRISSSINTFNWNQLGLLIGSASCMSVCYWAW